MKHIHLKTCQSTQEELINLEKVTGEKYLISTDSQTSGRGRRENKWESDLNSLCFSMTLIPNDELTLTAAEIGVLIAEFFDKKLKLKWPNDILNNRLEKCGGILINKIKDELIIGIGLNINPSEFQDFDIKAGSINLTDTSFKHETLSHQIATYIHNNRLTPKQTINKWISLCAHIDIQVSITEDDKLTFGKFVGIGKYGEALISVNNETQSFYNGTLRIKN